MTDYSYSLFLSFLSSLLPKTIKFLDIPVDDYLDFSMTSESPGVLNLTSIAFLTEVFYYEHSWNIVQLLTN